MFSLNKVPKTINIGGFKFDIEPINEVLELEDATQKTTQEIDIITQMGEMIIAELLIKIKDNMPIEMQKSTLCHEIIEAWNSIYDIKLKHNQIMTLENCLYKLMTDN
jgi:hypothetical protein